MWVVGPKALLTSQLILFSFCLVVGSREAGDGDVAVGLVTSDDDGG